MFLSINCFLTFVLFDNCILKSISVFVTFWLLNINTSWYKSFHLVFFFFAYVGVFLFHVTQAQNVFTSSSSGFDDQGRNYNKTKHFFKVTRAINTAKPDERSWNLFLTTAEWQQQIWEIWRQRSRVRSCGEELMPFLETAIRNSCCRGCLNKVKVKLHFKAFYQFNSFPENKDFIL